MDNEQKQVAKPLGIVRKELQENIINAINNSGLPLVLTAYILRDITEQLNVTVSQQESAEIAEYEAKLAELSNKK